MWSLPDNTGQNEDMRLLDGGAFNILGDPGHVVMSGAVLNATLPTNEYFDRRQKVLEMVERAHGSSQERIDAGEVTAGVITVPIVSVPGLEDPQARVIHQGDPVFYDPRFFHQLVLSEAAGMRSLAYPVFSSFAGHSGVLPDEYVAVWSLPQVTAGTTTTRKLARKSDMRLLSAEEEMLVLSAMFTEQNSSMTFQGVAAQYYDLNDPRSNPAGVSVMQRGKMTIVNRTNRIWLPSTWLTVEIPMQSYYTKLYRTPLDPPCDYRGRFVELNMSKNLAHKICGKSVLSVLRKDGGVGQASDAMFHGGRSFETVTMAAVGAPFPPVDEAPLFDDAQTAARLNSVRPTDRMAMMLIELVDAVASWAVTTHAEAVKPVNGVAETDTLIATVDAVNKASVYRSRLALAEIVAPKNLSLPDIMPQGNADHDSRVAAMRRLLEVSGASEAVSTAETKRAYARMSGCIKRLYDTLDAGALEKSLTMRNCGPVGRTTQTALPGQGCEVLFG